MNDLLYEDNLESVLWSKNFGSYTSVLEVRIKFSSYSVCKKSEGFSRGTFRLQK